MDRILIVGGNGFVGGRLSQLGKIKGNRIAIADIGQECSISGCDYYCCDIGDYSQTEAVFAKFRPNLVVNVAAVADIDFAQLNQDIAYRVNVTGAANCARASKKVGSAYVWFSSDAVFDGKAAIYGEDDPRQPVNYYGETKLLGEQAVLAENTNAIVLRLSLILGMPVKSGNSFLSGMIKRIKGGEVIMCPEEEIRTPIDVLTLCEAIYELYEMDFHGLLHLGAVDSIDRYEMSRLIAQKAGLDSTLVQAAKQKAPGKAPRHLNGIISVEKARGILKSTKLLTCEKTIERAVKMLEGKEE